jgi:hypothetical protein
MSSLVWLSASYSLFKNVFQIQQSPSHASPASPRQSSGAECCYLQTNQHLHMAMEYTAVRLALAGSFLTIVRMELWMMLRIGARTWEATCSAL